MNFKHWLELDEGIGNIMLPILMGAATPDAPPIQKKDTIETPKQDIEALLSGPLFDKSMTGKIVTLANKTLNDLDVLEDNLTAAVTNTRENPEDLLAMTPNNSVITIHFYIDELRQRLKTFTNPENFDGIAEVFNKQPISYVQRWMEKISEIQRLSEKDKSKAYKQFINEYPDILKKAESRASLVRMAHPEDSKSEYERYKQDVEAEINAKRKR